MKLVSLSNLLRFTIAAVLIAEGVDKFYNKLADWPVYTAPQILDLLPIAHSEFLGILGITEVAVGVILLFNAWFGGLLAAFLMFGIVTNLVLLGSFYNIALLNAIVGLACLSISQSAQYSKKPPSVPPPINSSKPKDKKRSTKNI
jgi:hypothetical protein